MDTQLNTDYSEGATDEVLAKVDLHYIRETYGYPHMVGHRSSLAGEMYKGCQQQNKCINFFFASPITSVESFTPKPTFTVSPRKGGEPYTITCDVLLGADGVKSLIRQQMLQTLDISAKVVDSGQAAYRIMLSRSDLSHSPSLLALLDGDHVIRWIGPRRHIIAYPVSSKQVLNISTAQPDTHFAAAPDETYTTRGDKKTMQHVYADFCPLVQDLLALVPAGELCEWRLRLHAPLPTWTHGCVALLGDACHPTLPHLAQGAAQAVEDAAVLGVVLSRLPSADPAAIAKTLRVYEICRKERAEALVELAAANGRELHLGKGEAQEERDKAFAKVRAGGAKGQVPDKWADADVQKNIYGQDVMAIAEEKFQELFAKA